ncbi:MAG: Ig-like domain-containing protein [Bacteroidota bacterium]
MKNKFFLSIILLFIAVFLTRCASVVPPNGGPKDVVAPILTSSDPTNNSKNFNQKSFTIGFNEFIKLDNVEEQLIITPSLKTKPNVKIKGKTIVVKFEDNLESNTTYSFNFGESIKDITEGNSASNLKYIFSTGAYIDSSKISGVVFDAYNEKPIPSMIVMLYKNNTDSLPLTQMPNYITKSNNSGRFLFTNVKPGKYKIFALIDKNANFIYDLPNESLAFVDTIVSTYDTLGIEMKMSSFIEELRDIKIMNKSAMQYGKIMLTFNKQFDSLSFKDLLPNKNTFIFEPGVKKDTMLIWIKPSTIDSMKLMVLNNNIIVDTVELKLLPKDPPKNSRRGSNKEVVFGAIPLFNANSFDLNKAFAIRTFAPIETFDKSKTIFICDKDTLIDFKFSFNNVKSLFFIENNWKENTDYQIIFMPGSFTDILGTTNDTLIYKFKTREISYYAQLFMDLSLSKTQGKSVIIQFLNDKDQILFEESINTNQKINLPFQNPGKYKLKAIIDENGNGKWDTGNYREKRQPEKVLFYKEEILLRSNWDVEVKWDISN